MADVGNTPTAESGEATAPTSAGAPGLGKQILALLGGILGTLMFVTGLVLPLFEFELTDWLVLTLLIGGLAMSGGLLLWLLAVPGESVAMRRAIYGTIVFLCLALLTGGLVFINILTYKYGGAPIDLTRKGVNSISEQTVNILKGLKRPIHILVLYSEQNAARFRIEALLDLYRRHSAKVDVEYTNPFRDRKKAEDFMRTYPDLSLPGVVIEYGEGDEADHICLKESDLFSISSQFSGMIANQQVKNEFKGEDAITSAISQLTEGKQTVKLYFTTGYGQLDLDDSAQRSATGLGVAKGRLENLKWEVNSLDLTKEEQVPEDATLVVVPGPQQALPETHIQALRDYMDKGGRMLVLADFAYDRVKGQMARTGLEDLLADYNVELGNNRVLEVVPTIFGEIRISPHVESYPADNDHPVAQGLGRRNVVLPECRTVKSTSRPPMPPGRGGPPPEQFQAVPILETTRNAWGEADLVGQQISRGDQGDEEGPVTVAVAVSESTAPPMPPMPGQPPPPPGPQTPRMVVIGDAEFLANDAYNHSADTLLMNCINWLRGRLDMLGIPPKETESLVLEPGTEIWPMVWKPGVLMMCVFLFGGFTVWVIRHRF